MIFFVGLMTEIHLIKDNQIECHKFKYFAFDFFT